MLKTFSEKTTKRTLLALFLVIGAIAGISRSLIFDKPRVLSEDQIWRISLKNRITSQKDITFLYTQKPKASANYRVIAQNIYHPDFKVLSTKQHSNFIKAKALKTGTLDWIVTYQILKTVNQGDNRKLINLNTILREKYLSLDSLQNTSTIQELNKLLKYNTYTQEALFEKILKHTHKLISIQNTKYNNLANIITDNKATNFGRSSLLVTLSRMNNIPSRLVTGIILEERSSANLYHWVEIYNEEQQAWDSYDLEKGFLTSLPSNYVPFSYNSSDITQVENGKIKTKLISIEEDIDVLNMLSMEQEKDILDILELRRFDFDTQQTLKQLLILPFCVLLTAFIRHVLGFYPYGTFTAPILALAMIYAEIQITLVLGVIVIFLALIGRSIMPKSLSRTPRLSLIFTFVVISMVASVSILSYFEINASGNIILLPTIILVSIVDRFYSYMDNAGAHAALIRLGVTIFIALLCTPIFEFKILGDSILTFPEAHLFTASLILILSSYKGKKLTDYRLLKLLGENKKSQKQA